MSPYSWTSTRRTEADRLEREARTGRDTGVEGVLGIDDTDDEGVDCEAVKARTVRLWSAAKRRAAPAEEAREASAAVATLRRA
jgi:hypothetical protein